MKRRAIDLVCTFVAPLVVTLAALRYLVPTRMDEGEQGFLARAADDHPLLLGVVLFVVLSETARYWRRRAERDTEPSRPSRRQALRFAILLATIAVVAFLSRASVADVDRVVGLSMAPTLNSGDRVLVNQLAYGIKLPFSKRPLWPKPPRRGDVIVFPVENAQGSQPRSMVKRVIGLPGDVVAFAGGSPIVNGWPVPSCDAGPFVTTMGTLAVRGRVAVEFLGDERYLTVRTPLDRSAFGGYLVPDGEVFVLGDDRGISSDSRAWNEGHGAGVRIDSIEGRVSRLAAGASRDGRLDLRRLFGRLDLAIHEPNVDTRETSRRIADCLEHPPGQTLPPRDR
jgi:signal peptidase I